MASTENPKKWVSTTMTSFRILEYLLEQEGSTIDGVASGLDIALSTAHRHLHTLQHLGYVIRDDGRYEIAVQTLAFGDYARSRKPGYNLAREKVNELAEDTGERVQFIVEEHWKGVYVSVAHGQKAVKSDPRLGRSFPLNAGGAGKIILAYKSDEEIEEFIASQGLPQVTPYTITDAAELFDEIELIRRRGYATNRNEFIQGLSAVAVPIEQPNGELLGTLAIGGPSQRVRGEYFEEELPRLLKGSANEIELNLKHTR